MNTFVEQLLREHSEIRDLLSVLAREADRLEQSGEANDGVMLDILLYMAHHPDLFHHPNEELMFSRLLMHVTREPEPVRKLRQEHIKLSDVAEQLMDEVRARVNDIPVDQAELAAQCRRYVELLSEHMALEESEVFPLCLRRLEQPDWEWIETRAATRETPFARDLGRRHVDFYRRILEES